MQQAHGASVSFTVSKQTAYGILPDEEAQRGTSVAFLNAVKYSIDVVSGAYVDACIQAGVRHSELCPFI